MGEILVITVIVLIVFGPLVLRARRKRPPTERGTRRWEPTSLKQLVLAVVAGGVVANVLDTIVHGFLLANAYYAQQTGLFREDGSPAWLVLGDFVAVAVFVWVYMRVRQSFGGGAIGGATFGLYAGVLIGFPTHIFLNLVIIDFSYTLAWAWTVH